MTARKIVEAGSRLNVQQAKPKELTREQFERLYKRVVRRIPRTLAILAK